MDGDLLIAINCDITATNTEFSNAGGSVLTLIGGSYYFAHCTVANYMSLTQRDLSSVTSLDSKCLYLLSNTTVDGSGPYPIVKAYFDNCIIDGSYSAGDFFTSGEILLQADDDSEFDYLFNHCLLKAVETTSDHFEENLFNESSETLYRMTGGQSNKYVYDFRLASESTMGVGQADRSVTQNYPIDRYGVNRLTSEYGPTIGAYEYVPEETTDADE